MSAPKSQVPLVESTPDRVAAILLAAGASARLGQPKQLVTLPGEDEPLIRRAARLALEIGCSPVVIVLGACDQPCRQALAGLSGVRILYNQHWQEGMGTTLRAGILALPDETPVTSALVMVTDQLRLSRESLARLLAQHRLRFDAPATAAWYGGRPGVPAIFRRTLFPALAALRADQGARFLLAQLGNAIATVPMPEAVFDLDTQEDLRALTGES